MRKKAFIYWGAIFLTVLLIGFGAAFLGRDRGPRISSCLPKPGAGVPYLLVERVPGPTGMGSSEGPFGLVRSTLGEKAWEAFLEANSDVPVSFIVTFGEQGARFWSAAAIDRKAMDELSGGKLPVRWGEVFEGNLLQEESEGKERTWRLVYTDGVSLFLRKEGNLLFAADSPGELDRMQAARAGRLEAVSAAWRVKPAWMGHLRVTDAGKPDLLPIPGIGPGRVDKLEPVMIEAAWRPVPPFGGEGAWISEGVGKRIAAGAGLLAGPIPWDAKLAFPEPLALAMGVNWSAPSSSAGEVSGDEGEAGFQDNMGFWKTWTGLPEERVRRFLRGPVVLSVGGAARTMGLPTPGFLVEFPGRKEEGEVFVRSLLGERWGISGLLGRDVKGFDVGGAIPLPFTVMAAANRETALVGYLEPESLGNPRFPGELSPEFNAPAFSWLWIDGAILSKAIEDLGPGSPGFRLLGLEGKTLDLDLAARLVGSLGKLSSVMPTPESGKVTWSGVEPQVGQP